MKRLRKKEPEFHFLVEQTSCFLPECEGREYETERSGDMNCYLLREARKRGLSKSIFENIEIRYLSGKATDIFNRPRLSHMIERCKAGRTNPIKLPELTLEGLREAYYEVFPGIKPDPVSLEHFLKGTLDWAKQTKFDEPEETDEDHWREFENEVTYKKGTQLFTLDTLTFGEVITEYENQVAEFDRYEQTLSGVELKEFQYRMEGADGKHGRKGDLKKFKKFLLSHGAQFDKTIFDFAKTLDKAKRKMWSEAFTNVGAYILPTGSHTNCQTNNQA